MTPSCPHRPDNWGLKSPDFQKQFIESHLAEAANSIPGKPVILEEFGKITEDKANEIRNQYFAAAHAVAEQNAKSGGSLMGTLFWHAACDAARLSHDLSHASDAARLAHDLSHASSRAPKRHWYDEGMGPGQYGGAWLSSCVQPE